MSSVNTIPTPVATHAATDTTSVNRPPRNRKRGRGPPKDAGKDGRSMRLHSSNAEPAGTAGIADSRLNGDAREFVPASTLPTAKRERPKRHQNLKQPPQGGKNHIEATAITPPTDVATGPSKRRASLLRSTAPDIATRVHEDIAKSIYECAICTNEIGRNSKHRKVRFKMDNSLLRSNGGVPGVIYRRRRYLRHIAAGVRRNWIRDLFLVYLHILVDKLAADRRLSPNRALTHAI
ncbi:hypothetical protein EPUS_06428 [Endocarpon pusillum Z07020]|uniref:Uncharacterized protein n=1 Tax=Endocarpon pusillum (strain Z07020 / HMAS-L-300199) TaxID=1263415 RepID=U1G7R8_ENDPU|nr:uncharacterized protein EPUS_06428 [Endocarpon pusillum Z07020]ERF68038.1 hypothetical protein EPUS_06428 [Endocarpon pusillum Z07020]